MLLLQNGKSRLLESKFGLRVGGRLLRDQRGQATTEYILMLAIVVSLLMFAMKNLLKPMFDGLTKRLSGRFDKFFSGDLHHLRFGGR